MSTVKARNADNDGFIYFYAETGDGTLADPFRNTTLATAANTKLDSIIALMESPLSITGSSVSIAGSVAVTGTFWQATQPVSIAAPVAVTGTFWQATQPVSAASLPLPTGAASEATLASMLTALQLIDNMISGAGINITQLGSAAISMGTGVRDAGTQRVTIATNDSVPVTGTFWQATQPVSLASLPALAAGTNNIGDVDVLSLPATPAGTNLIGKTSSGLDVSNLYDGSNVLVPKFAKLSSATSGNQTLVAAVVGKKIRIVALHILAGASTNNIYINDGTDDLYGDATRKIPLDVTGAAGAGGFALPFNPVGWFETGATNRPINVNLGSANSVLAIATYVEV
jgi:hypothetical protein